MPSCYALLNFTGSWVYEVLIVAPMFTVVIIVVVFDSSHAYVFHVVTAVESRLLLLDSWVIEILEANVFLAFAFRCGDSISFPLLILMSVPFVNGTSPSLSRRNLHNWAVRSGLVFRGPGRRQGDAIGMNKSFTLFLRNMYY